VRNRLTTTGPACLASRTARSLSIPHTSHITVQRSECATDRLSLHETFVSDPAARRSEVKTALLVRRFFHRLCHVSRCSDLSAGSKDSGFASEAVFSLSYYPCPRLDQPSLGSTRKECLPERVCQGMGGILWRMGFHSRLGEPSS
jgi:hypothetical protein